MFQNEQQNASWHDDYRHSCYIFIANLNYGMNEGDIAIVFSQYGEPIDVYLFRDKLTGKSRGFCFLAYEDQRSTVLAVDNFNSAEICGRKLRVDHVKEFKVPREYLDISKDDPEIFDKLYKPSGPDGRGWGEFRKLTDQEKQLNEQIQAQQKELQDRNERVYENIQLIQDTKKIIDEDERWDRMLMIEDEKQQMKDKIKQLQEYNTKHTKVKYDKGQVLETNEQRQARIEKKQKKSIDKKKQKKEKSYKKIIVKGMLQQEKIKNDKKL